METHPFANVLPLLEGAAFDSLAADIRLNGLIEPITLLDGQILDGRNRWRACVAAGIEPRFRDFDGGDPLAFVISMNLHRRHLDESQRAMVAARLETMLHGGNRQDVNLHLAVTRADAARLLNVSPRSVASARAVLDSGGAGLIDAVALGSIAVSVAAGLAFAPEEIQRQAAADPARAHVLAKQTARTIREAGLAARQRSLPSKCYGVIYADPPWRWEAYSSETGLARGPSSHYPTMTLDEIIALDVASIAADDCALFLWTTAPMVPEALGVMAAWGFRYRTGVVWAKDRIGMGYWFRSLHEHLLTGTRGDPPAPAPGTQWPSVIEAPVREHSRKPDEAYELIEAYFPNLPKIELFARGPARQGWDAWGNEAEAAE